MHAIGQTSGATPRKMQALDIMDECWPSERTSQLKELRRTVMMLLYARHGRSTTE